MDAADNRTPGAWPHIHDKLEVREVRRRTFKFKIETQHNERGGEQPTFVTVQARSMNHAWRKIGQAAVDLKRDAAYWANREVVSITFWEAT